MLLELYSTSKSAILIFFIGVPSRTATLVVRYSCQKNALIFACLHPPLSVAVDSGEDENAMDSDRHNSPGFDVNAGSASLAEKKRK